MDKGASPLRGESQDDLPLTEELRRLADGARDYARAETAFQKSRAAVVLRAVRYIAVLGVAAFVIAVFGLGALVVGLLIALTPLVTAWGATAIVAGGLFILALVFVALARARWQRMMQLITSGDGAP